jgi:hypothetical protein
MRAARHLSRLLLAFLVLTGGCASPSRSGNAVRPSRRSDLRLIMSLEDDARFRIVLKNASSDRIWEHYVSPLFTLWVVREGDVPTCHRRGLGGSVSVCPVPIMEPDEEQVFHVRPSEFGVLSREKTSLKNALVFIEYQRGNDKLYSNTIRIGSDISTGGWPTADSSPAPVAETNDTAAIDQISEDIDGLIDRDFQSYHKLLRELYNGDAINCHFLVRTNVFMTSAGYDLDLYIIFCSDKKDRKCPTTQPGEVMRAEATLVEDVHLPFDELLSQCRFPEGSVLHGILKEEDVVETGAVWPLVNRLCVSYGFLHDRWLDSNPHGFRINVEFEVDPQKRLEYKNIRFTAPSGLDPWKHWNGTLYTQGFEAADTIGSFETAGGGGRWHGNGPEIENTKRNYLKGYDASVPQE